MAFSALRWFARGGSHLNFYMWWGGYNRGRAAAERITNFYSSEAPMCPSGQRHQPKFDHFQQMISVLQDIAPILVGAPSALSSGKQLYVCAANGSWVLGNEQRLFVYRNDDEQGSRVIEFVENASNMSVAVRLPSPESKEISMNEYSSVILVDGNPVFDSSKIADASMMYTREIELYPMALRNWTVCPEGIGPDLDHFHDYVYTGALPVEQTLLNTNMASPVDSDYAWYGTDFMLDSLEGGAELVIETQYADCFLAFVDDKYAGTATWGKNDGTNTTLTIRLPTLKQGQHTLAFLSESLGYSNLIGRWSGTGTKAKKKGITGVILLQTSSQNIMLTDGRDWRSLGGLHGERAGFNRGVSCSKDSPLSLAPFQSTTAILIDAAFTPETSQGPTWTQVLFDSATYDPTKRGLFLSVTCGRGHIWLNGYDLGRYWNITRGETATYSQRYYLLPHEYLTTDSPNKLVFFDVFGCNHTADTSLVYSWVGRSDGIKSFQDEVDFPMACI
jgi:beta-galactosidase